MKTSRPSRSDSIYSSPFCGRVTFTLPMFSGCPANAFLALPCAGFPAFAFGAFAIPSSLKSFRFLFDNRTPVRVRLRSSGFCEAVKDFRVFDQDASPGRLARRPFGEQVEQLGVVGLGGLVRVRPV